MLRSAMLVILLVAGQKSALADTPQSTRDSHPLSREEMRTFLPLVCLDAVPSRMPGALAGVANFNCQRLIGYGDAVAGDIALSAIAYGPFTGRRAEEAYISYLSEREPHSNDYGGGILFSRSGGHWLLVRWYPGQAMRNCLALPSQGQQRMLCLTSWTGQGEIDTSVWIEKVGTKLPEHQHPLIKAQDDRGELDPDEANTESYPCVLGGHTHKAMLLTIDSLTRSTAVAEFARSKITYATAKDVGAACSAGHFESIQTKTGTVRYFIKSGAVVVSAPYEFSKTDY